MPDSLVLEPRVTGKTKFARDLRKAGLIPGVLYGRGAEPVSFQVDVPSLREALSGEAGRHAVLKLKVPGRKGDTHAVLKDYQLDPVRDRLIHIDLLEISMTELIVSSVNVRLEGEAQGVKDGGVLEQASHELEVEALPANLPTEIVVDISELVAGNAIRVADITLPERRRVQVRSRHRRRRRAAGDHDGADRGRAGRRAGGPGPHAGRAGRGRGSRRGRRRRRSAPDAE